MAAPKFEHVTAIVDGYELAGWEEIEVRRSMQSAAISFTLKATWPDLSEAALKLRNADQIEIRTQALAEGQPPTPGAGDLLCLGGVDDYEADIGEGGHKTTTLHGRSNARDVIDCPPVDHPTSQVQNKTIVEAAQALGKEFGVTWSTDIARNLVKIANIVCNPGEALYRAIERHARAEGVMLSGQPDGSIKITRAGSQRHPGSLVEGRPPVTRWSVKLDLKSRRSKIVTRGQRVNSADPADLSQEHEFTPTDPPARHRPSAVYLEEDRPTNKLRTRGEWHHLRSFGHGMVVGPRVSSWRDDAGTLWTPGFLMAINVAAEQIEMDMTLSEATFKQNLGVDGGTRAELVFVDPRSHGGSAPAGSKEPTDFNPGDTLPHVSDAI